MKRRPAIGRLRGKTRAGRLALWDALLLELGAAWTTHGVAEVGAGERADTVLELAAVLAGTGASLEVLEVHPQRAAMVRAALVGRGGTVTRVDALEPSAVRQVGVLRCANVLRQYPVAEVPAAHAALASRVVPGGRVMEGTCDAGGDVGAFHLLEVDEAGHKRAALVFFSSFSRGFAPIQLRDWLPRDLRREVRQDGLMQDFFERWTSAWRTARTGVPAEDFRRAAHRLGCRVVDLAAVRPGAAAMVWRPPGGVPGP